LVLSLSIGENLNDLVYVIKMISEVLFAEI